MPATPIYALPYPAAIDPADVPLDLQKLADQVAKVLGGALSATPPATPVDGQLWAMSPLAGVVWVFRYNASSASAFKWEFVGGPPLVAGVAANESSGSGTFTDLATPGPTVTLPRAGDYMVAFNAEASNTTAAQGAIIAPKFGAAATSDNDRGVVWGASPFALARPLLVRQGAAAGEIVKLQYRTTGSGTIFAGQRQLAATPIRVS